MPTGRILIVEDEALVAEDLRQSLSTSGYEVVGIADSFASAADLIERTSPDMALLDIRLKGERDGIELAAELRRLDVGHIYLTAHSDEGTMQRAERTEPLGYILKPFRTREVLPVLRTALYRQDCERRLRGLERWLSTVLRSIGDAVVVTDRSARVTYVNPAAERLLDRAMRDLIGATLAEALPILGGDLREAVQCVATRAMSSNAIVHLESDAQLRRHDGSLVPIDDCAAPIPDTDGSVAGAVVVLRDASEQRELARQQRAAEAQVAEARRVESIAMMATGLAHDLNNALTTILGNLSLCRDDAYPDRTAAIAEAERAARAAGQMCRRLLTDNGAAPTPLRPVELDPVIAEIVAAEQRHWQDRVGLSVSSETEGLGVQADPLQLRQVLVNLLRNACEACAPTRAHVVVRTGLIRLPNALLGGHRAAASLAPGRYVWLEVCDDGPGMTPEVTARVFEPFFSTKQNGNGLGLASACAIVRRHGGAIEVESEVGIGSVFRVFLPIAVAEPIVPESLPTPAEQVAPELLLVDDDESVRGVTRRLLESRGWRCHAVSGAAALQQLHRAPTVAAMIVDNSIAGTDVAGFIAATRQVRADLPVLVVSSMAELPLPDDMPDVAFVAKPFLIEELIARLWQLIRGTQP
ncbi:MAG: response regulator [Planctomycetes bacterium]|nr:response regulator [Planctomycetota bacterium]